MTNPLEEFEQALREAVADGLIITPLLTELLVDMSQTGRVDLHLLIAAAQEQTALTPDGPRSMRRAE